MMGNLGLFSNLANVLCGFPIGIISPSFTEVIWPSGTCFTFKM